MKSQTKYKTIQCIMSMYLCWHTDNFKKRKMCYLEILEMSIGCYCSAGDFMGHSTSSALSTHPAASAVDLKASLTSHSSEHSGCCSASWAALWGARISSIGSQLSPVVSLLWIPSSVSSNGSLLSSVSSNGSTVSSDVSLHQMDK